MNSEGKTVKDKSGMATWHVAPTTFSYNARTDPLVTDIPAKQESSFFKKVSKLIPEIKMPSDCIIGSTGYPSRRYDAPTDLFGWFYDEFNRELFVIGNYLIFQRYTGVDSHRYRQLSNNQGWNILDEKIEGELIKLVEAHNLLQSQKSS